MKVLSIIIPAFNTELYIKRCLDSLLYDRTIVGDLDIIVVDDGSTDGTARIAEDYQKEFPDSVSVVKKKNGGHGSAVNAGMRKAIGKYVKVIDSDDWVNIYDFSRFVKDLQTEDADIVVTNVRRQQLYDASSLDFLFCNEKQQKQGIEMVVKKVMDKSFFFEFSMHSMTVKRVMLKKVWGEGLLEKTFYVDQQFVAKVFSGARNFVELPLLIYMYFIGRPEQSMGAGFFKHIDDHERVLRWLLKSLDEGETTEHYKAIVSRQIVLMLDTHYQAFLDQKSIEEKKRQAFMDFDKFLRKKYPKYYNEAELTAMMKDFKSPLRKTRVGRAIIYSRRRKK